MGFADELMRSFDRGDLQRSEDRHRAIYSVATRLETEYAERGLRFTCPFWGAVPTQANGWIDGMRFYFRYRNDQGSLEVGPFNAELEHRIFTKLEQNRMQRVKENYSAWEKGRMSGPEFRLALAIDSYRPEAKEDDAEYAPNDIRFVAVIKNYTGFPHNGFLAPDQCYDLFKRLVDTLEPIPEDEWIRANLVEWLDN